MNISASCENKSENFTNLLDLYGGYEGLYDAFTIQGSLKRVTTPIWLILGIPGSIFCIILWTRPRMLHTSSVYLAALGASDLGFLICQIIWFLKTSCKIDMLRMPVFCELFAVTFYFSQYLSPLFTFGFTLERFILICFPFKGERFLSLTRAVKATIITILIALSLSVIQGFFFQYKKEKQLCEERDSVLDDGTWQNKLLWYWNLITEPVIFGLIPIAILLLNILVIKEAKVLQRKTPVKFKLTDKKDSNSKMKKLGNKNASTTVMVLSVSFYFILSSLPVTIVQILVIHKYLNGDVCLTPEEARIDPTWRAHWTIINVKYIIESLAMSHYAAKFYIYMITGKLFRIEFINLFKRHRSKQIPSRRNGLETRNTLLDHCQSMDGSVHNISTRS